MVVYRHNILIARAGGLQRCKERRGVGSVIMQKRKRSDEVRWDIL